MRVFLPIITTGYTIFITLKKIGSYDEQLMFTLIVALPSIIIAFIVIVMVGRGVYANGSISLPEWIAYFGFATSM